MHNFCTRAYQTIFNNLKIVNNDALSTVISQHKCDFIFNTRNNNKYYFLDEKIKSRLPGN